MSIIRIAILLLSVCGVWLWLSVSNPVMAQRAQLQALHRVNSVDSDVKFLSFESESNWIFQVADSRAEVAPSQIVRWGSWPGVVSKQAVWLSDGSWLCGELRIEADERIVVDSDWLRTQSVPLKAARGVVLTPPRTLPRWLELQSQMLAATGERDVLWLSGGRKLSGVIRWPTTSPTSSIDSIDVDTGGQSVQLSLDVVEAIAFSPTLVGSLPSRVGMGPNRLGVQIGLVDGSLFYTKQFARSATQVMLTLEGSLQLASLDTPGEFSKAVCLLGGAGGAGGAGGQAQFLSQLEPASYRNLSDSSLGWELGRDSDVLRRPLHGSNGQYFHGLAMHSSSQVAFRWDGSPGRLLSEVVFAAPPPQADPGLGSVQCQVLLARAGKLQSVHEFSLNRSVHGQTESREIVDIDITDAKLVVLVTEKADFGQFGDHILWLDARFSK